MIWLLFRDALRMSSLSCLHVNSLIHSTILWCLLNAFTKSSNYYTSMPSWSHLCLAIFSASLSCILYIIITKFVYTIGYLQPESLYFYTFIGEHHFCLTQCLKLIHLTCLNLPHLSSCRRPLTTVHKSVSPTLHFWTFQHSTILFTFFTQWPVNSWIPFERGNDRMIQLVILQRHLSNWRNSLDFVKQIAFFSSFSEF